MHASKHAGYSRKGAAFYVEHDRPRRGAGSAALMILYHAGLQQDPGAVYAIYNLPLS